MLASIFREEREKALWKEGEEKILRGEGTEEGLSARMIGGKSCPKDNHQRQGRGRPLYAIRAERGERFNGKGSHIEGGDADITSIAQGREFG